MDPKRRYVIVRSVDVSSLPKTPRRDRWLTVLPAVVLVVGMLGSVAASRWEHEHTVARRHKRFRSETDLIVGSIRSSVRRYEAINDAIRETAVPSDGHRPTASEFALLTNSLVLDSRFPGAFGIAWADSVPTARLQEFLADPSIPRSDLEDLRPNPNAARAVVVTLSGPESTMAIARGVDARLFPSLAQTMDRATDAGSTQVSSRFALPLRVGPEKARAPVVVMFLRPAYRSTVVPPTVEERRRQVIGFSGVALDMGRFVPAALGVNGGRYAAAIYDGTVDAEHRFGAGPLQAAPNGQRRRDVIALFGRSWIVETSEAEVTDYGETDLSRPFLAAGLILTGLVVIVVSLLTRSERRALQLVKRATAELSRRASEDALTGLANRAELMARLEIARDQAKPGSAGPTVFFLDLDRFKMINDSLGHVVGDELLVEIAERLRRASRDHDTVARFGGDEFVVMVDDLAGDEHVHRLAARLQDAFVEPVHIGERTFDMSASIGIARASSDEWTPASLIRDADVAMYDAKHRTPGSSSIFEQGLGRRASDRLDMVNGFGDALARQEFVLEYQPIVGTTTGELLGFEALLRWNHPDRGKLRAAEFIELAEESGAIVSIGSWVLRTACETATSWHRAGRPAASVWVNISSKQLARPSFASEAMEVLTRTGLAPSLLCLEVTESALAPDLPATVENLEVLRRLGVRIAVDDFGVGYSSFAQLRRLPVDVLKLDRSFIERLGVDPDDRAIVRTMIELAHALGMTTVAEGVEHELQARELTALGCDALQGWLTGSPTSARGLAGFDIARSPVPRLVG